MVADLAESYTVNLKATLEALKNWHQFQSASNTGALYNAASKLFGSDFDPTEYDDVE